VNLSIILDVQDSLFTWLATNYPLLTGIILIVLITGVIVYRFSGLVHRFRKTENDCGQLNNNQIALNKRLGSIDSKLNTLIIHLSSTKKIDSNLFRTQSPIELTEAGSKILSDMGGKNYVDSHLETLINQIQKQDFKSGLDVQNYCSVMLNERIIEDDALIPVKNYIYTNPIYKIDDNTSIPLDLTVSVTIMGIYLRNKYFEKYPELKHGM